MEPESLPSDFAKAAAVAHMEVTCLIAKGLGMPASQSEIRIETSPGADKKRINTPELLKKLKANGKEKALTEETPRRNERIAGKLDQSAPAFVYRLYRYKDSAQAKIDNHREILRRLEVADCSFSPKLTSKQLSTPHRQPLGKIYQSPPRTNPIDRLEDTEKLDFRPKIDEKSVEMCKNRPAGSVFDTLYSVNKTVVRTDTESSALTFRPNINKSSEQLLRHQDISTALYQDAQRRRTITENHSSFSHSAGVATGKQSLQLLRDRFREEFHRAVSSSSKLEFLELCDVLAELRFIKDLSEDEKFSAKQAFDYLSTKSKTVVCDSLYSFLLAVLHLPQEVDSLSPAESSAIRKRFHQMAITRMSLAEDYNSKVTLPKSILRGYLHEIRTEDGVYRRRAQTTAQKDAGKQASRLKVISEIQQFCLKSPLTGSS